MWSGGRDLVALRDSMRDSAARYPRPGEPLQAVAGAQTASSLLAALTGVVVFLGPGTGLLDQIPARRQTSRVHRFFNVDTADASLTWA